MALMSVLSSEEVVASAEPAQRIFLAIIGGEGELVVSWNTKAILCIISWGMDWRVVRLYWWDWGRRMRKGNLCDGNSWRWPGCGDDDGRCRQRRRATTKTRHAIQEGRRMWRGRPGGRRPRGAGLGKRRRGSGADCQGRKRRGRRSCWRRPRGAGPGGGGVETEGGSAPWRSGRGGAPSPRVGYSVAAGAPATVPRVGYSAAAGAPAAIGGRFSTSASREEI